MSYTRAGLLQGTFDLRRQFADETKEWNHIAIARALES
jgi:hypothetical protein